SSLPLHPFRPPLLLSVEGGDSQAGAEVCHEAVGICERDEGAAGGGGAERAPDVHGPGADEVDADDAGGAADVGNAPVGAKLGAETVNPRPVPPRGAGDLRERDAFVRRSVMEA